MSGTSDIAVVLDATRDFIRRFVVMADDQAIAVVLWVFHTHAFDAADYSPYLAITSPEMRSGKTTLMKLLELLTARPWRVITPSEAVVFRKINRDRPTLLLDEYDTIFQERDYEPLRAILNAGNEPGTCVPRCVGPSQQLEDFAVFCPKALAGIGRLPTTVADRTIEIALKRKAAGETAARFRRREVAEAAEPLHQALASLASNDVDVLAEARPELPNALDDRAQDAWEPLLAIADRAGGDWPEVARQAALALSDSRATANDDSDRLQLLADIRNVFNRLECERILTVDLVTELARDDELPWTEWWDERDNKPKRGAAMKLAGKLRPFGVHSRDIRAPEGSRKGYHRDQFEDAWSRYLPVSEAESRDSRDNPHGYSDPGPSESRDTTPSVAASEQAANLHEQSDVAAVATRNPGNGGSDQSEGVDQDVIERIGELARKAQARRAEQDQDPDTEENEQAVLAVVEELLVEGILVRRDQEQA